MAYKQKMCHLIKHQEIALLSEHTIAFVKSSANKCFVPAATEQADGCHAV